MFAVLLPPLVLVIGSCVTVEGSSSVSPAITSTYNSQTAPELTTSSTENTTTSTEIMTASSDATIVKTDETTSSTQTTDLTGVTTALTVATTAYSENTTTSTHMTATSPNKTTTSTNSMIPSTDATITSPNKTPTSTEIMTTSTKTMTTLTENMTDKTTVLTENEAASTNMTTASPQNTTTISTDSMPSTTLVDLTKSSTDETNITSSTKLTTSTFATTHTGNTTPSTQADNTSATTHTGSTNPMTPTGNASAPHTDTTVLVTHNDSNTNEPTAPITTSTMSTVTSNSSVVTEPETTKEVTVLPPAPSTGKPSGGTASQSDETLTSAQRTGIIVFVCMVVLIALITLGVIIITWRRRYKAAITEAVDLRSIVNHRSNNARISLHEAVLDDVSLAETDVTTVGKSRADDGTEDNPNDTNSSPSMRHKSCPTTAFANPTYRSDVIDKRRSFSTVKGDDSQDSCSSSTYAKGNNSRVRHSSADDILSKSLKKSRLSMTSVASLAQSLSLCGLEYFTHEEEVDKTSLAGAMECDPSIGESNGEVAESEDGVNGYAENGEGQNATFYMQ